MQVKFDLEDKHPTPSQTLTEEVPENYVQFNINGSEQSLISGASLIHRLKQETVAKPSTFARREHRHGSFE